MSKSDEERDSEILDQTAIMLEQTAEYQKLVKKLKPLVKTIQSSSEKVDEFRDFIKPLQTRFEKSEQRMPLFKEDSKADYDSRLNTLRKAFSFLALFETSVANILNCMVILLILNGHDFFVQYTRKYAKSLDDLDDSFSVAEKLDFLNFHGFAFLTENINKSLRNKIAHMDFDIEEKGVVIVEKQRHDLRTEIVKLEAVLLLTARALKNSGFASL